MLGYDRDKRQQLDVTLVIIIKKRIKSRLIARAMFGFSAIVCIAPHASSGDLWSEVHQDSAFKAVEESRVRIVSASQRAIKNALANAPLSSSSAPAVYITLPIPNGKNERFRVEESPVMVPHIAKKYPQLKTYRVFGVDSASASGRIGIAGDGTLYGSLSTPMGRVWIDSVNKVNQYRSFYPGETSANTLNQRYDSYSCGVQISGDEAARIRSFSPIAQHRYAARTEGSQRSYRIAIVGTAEYTNAIGGGDPENAFSGSNGVVAAVNRLNEIFNRELNIHLTLTSDENQLYTNPSTDNLDNLNPLTLIEQVAGALTGAPVNGESGYDIGHAFSTSRGGVASLGSVCSANKARGVSGQADPTTDAFWIDFVAHEIGHQLGARHTFNGTTGSCRGANRSAATAYEPGSGVTIMGYAGICGGENIQSRSIATFHPGSRLNIADFIARGSGGQCGSFVSATNSNNLAPAPDAGSDYIIPTRTPFTLTGSGSDADGDALQYAWDQIDAGELTDSSTHGQDLGSNALFRSFLPGSTPSRTFPQLSDLNANRFSRSEVLPTTERYLNFTLTAFDQNGGTNSDNVRLAVAGGAGPFTVLQPNRFVTLDSDSTTSDRMEYGLHQPSTS